MEVFSNLNGSVILSILFCFFSAWGLQINLQIPIQEKLQVYLHNPFKATKFLGQAAILLFSLEEIVALLSENSKVTIYTVKLL